MKQIWIIIPLVLFGVVGMQESLAEETKTIFIGPNLVDCVGVGPQKCMQIREDPNSSWENFYNSIKGFDYVQGNAYKISVKITDVEDPPADASSKKYELIEILDKKSYAKHIPYNNKCAPGFVPLGGICVLNDRCGPGAYPGKVCVMDGVTQPYLRPSQQGNAGIAAVDIVCIEGLNQIFKSHDGSPACVSDETKKKLEERGWQTIFPVFACTLEYAPVCGVDGKTYGNKCMITSNHVATKHVGECTDIISTEFELDEQYQKIQSDISKISSEIYNGQYNGDVPLAEALQILLDGKTKLSSVLEKYKSLEDEQKTDMQIAMRFSTLGKMGFASLDSQINMIKNQIENPSPEQIQSEAEKSFSVKYNSIKNVIKGYKDGFQDGQYVGVMFDTSMRKSILQSQYYIFELKEDLENKKDVISEQLYQEVSAEILILDESVQNMWDIINDHLGISPVSSETLQHTLNPPEIDSEKGYAVLEIADGVYWLVSSGYQAMFLTTEEGVVVIDAPQPIGEKYLDAISDVTVEPVSHMIYSHSHQDHTGAAGQIFTNDITYISHKDAAAELESENDPNRPVPSMILEGDFNTLEIGGKTIELHNIGDFHSKGNLLMVLPQHKVAMLVDLLRPAESPYRAFGVTPDIDLYLETHDTLQNFDFDVLVSGHTGLLATKEHIDTNKEFTLDVMENAKTALENNESDPVQYCIQTTIEQWNEKLGNLDAFMADHCNAMIEYHSIL